MEELGNTGPVQGPRGWWEVGGELGLLEFVSGGTAAAPGLLPGKTDVGLLLP